MSNKNIFSVIWRGARVWLIVTIAVLAIVLTLSLVATQNAFIYGTLCGVFGGEKNTVVSGDPSRYRYFTADTESFEYYQPVTELQYIYKFFSICFRNIRFIFIILLRFIFWCFSVTS